MAEPTTLMFVAGEVSGDMHAAELARAMSLRLPGTRMFGIGGPRMREVGVETLHDIEEMAVMGIPEVVRRLPFFRRVFNEMQRAAAERQPAAVILVDFPEFNLRFAEAAHRMGLKVIYYVCPQVWAWRRGRIPRMAATIDRLVTIFPFEAAHFEGTGLRADFVGHPLVEQARAARAAPSQDLQWKGEPRIALLPGSRRNEIDRILPVIWKAAGTVQDRFPSAGFVVASPSESIAELTRQRIADVEGGPRNWTIVVGKTREVLRQAAAAMVVSGTATLEAALMRCPMVIAYRTALLTYLLSRLLVRVEHIGMVNIIAGKTVCPEFVQGDATPAALANALVPLVEDTPERSRMCDDLDRVIRQLGPGGAEQRAAAIVLEEIGIGRQEA